MYFARINLNVRSSGQKGIKMKKMMVALAGIVSVLMLASCQKVVEVDGDVSIEKTSYSYRMEVTGTASYVLAEYDSVKKEWKAKEDAKSVELVANEGWLNWRDYVNTNQKEYSINTWYSGDTEKAKLYLGNLDLDDLVEYKGEFYLGNVDPSKKVAVKGSPRDEEFTVTVTNLHAREPADWDSEGKVTSYNDLLLTFELTFSR